MLCVDEKGTRDVRCGEAQPCRTPAAPETWGLLSTDEPRTRRQPSIRPSQDPLLFPRLSTDSSIPCTSLISVLVLKDRRQIPATHAIRGPLATTDQRMPSMSTCLSLTFLPSLHPPTSRPTMLPPSTHLSTHPPVHTPTCPCTHLSPHGSIPPSSIRTLATSHSSPSHASPSSHEHSPVHPSVLMLGILWIPTTQGALLLGTQRE